MEGNPPQEVTNGQTRSWLAEEVESPDQRLFRERGKPGMPPWLLRYQRHRAGREPVGRGRPGRWGRPAGVRDDRAFSGTPRRLRGVCGVAGTPGRGRR